MHLGPRELYRGTGGIGVPDSPSLMFTTNVDCIACHRRGEESQAALHTSNYVERAIGEACVKGVAINGYPGPKSLAGIIDAVQRCDAVMCDQAR